ncbi:hypothetical protein N7X57_04970 [Lactiplantibacillus paraplantarum]|uniref:hypothetical protein n=1 Tax=Lactiplantibacillus paraplantarum TaxID=60520 RepID=UPI0007E317AF|nr:hypothetical protein [Lactiplantibacillus paraplantarum]MCW1909812.1 hypothetical protein [Lactiplantibacillus paraplantarum]OAX75348.1 hypothetical protein A0U96_06265 [Lactiplantibacillus plantarum]
MRVRLRGRWLLGLLLGMGLWGEITVQAATDMVRWPVVQSLTPRNCELKAKQTRLYQLNYATMQVTPRGIARTTKKWQRTGQVMLTQNGRLVTYWQVHQLRSNQSGWVIAANVQVTGARANDIVTPKRQPMHPVTQYQQVAAVTKTVTKTSYLSLKGAGRYTTNRILFHPTAAYVATQGMQSRPDKLMQSGGYRDHYHFKTALYLPQQLGSRTLNDPQSAAFSADNRYLYVMYVNDQQVAGADQTGWVVRYDWQRLMALGAGQSGKMAMLRVAAAHQFDGTMTAFDRRVLAAIQVGPEFTAGHVQSLALNPKTNELWFIASTASNQLASVARLNPQSLTPDLKIAFATGSGRLGDELTFDRAGRAYYWTHASQLRNGKVNLYRGTISPSTGVHFEQVSQGLANNPGFFAQSMGYNEVTGRLYLVADESITSIPAAQLGHLAASQVGEANFAGDREFEGLVFMHRKDVGFLLTNRGIEMMRIVVDK